MGRCSEENLEREDGGSGDGSTIAGGSGCSSFSLRPNSLLDLRTVTLPWFTCDVVDEEGPAVLDGGGGSKSAVDFARSRG